MIALSPVKSKKLKSFCLSKSLMFKYSLCSCAVSQSLCSGVRLFRWSEWVLCSQPLTSSSWYPVWLICHFEEFLHLYNQMIKFQQFFQVPFELKNLGHQCYIDCMNRVFFFLPVESQPFMVFLWVSISGRQMLVKPRAVQKSCIFLPVWCSKAREKTCTVMLEFR